MMGPMKISSFEFEFERRYSSFPRYLGDRLCLSSFTSLDVPLLDASVRDLFDQKFYDMFGRAHLERCAGGTLRYQNPIRND